jgi:mono/diheme cytochrome c family protein
MPARVTTSVLVLLGGAGFAAADEARFFETRVRPILQAHCVRCHGGARPRSGLDLTSRKGFLQGGTRGPLVSRDRPDESLLLRAVRHRDLEMPPKGKLPAEQIDLLAQWVKKGAPWPTTTVASRRGPPPVDAQARAFWSFRPVVRPKVPAVRDATWVRTPLDAFVLARLEAAGLRPAPPADRTALLRRLTYDLTGLPPAPEEVAAFLQDDSPDAYEKVVERLLASAAHGERWGRHWLDLVRYAETDGYEFDRVKPHVWRYRDYVIRSFNDDKPYDRFVTEQLAGDEAETVTADGIIATGYYRVGPWDSGAPDRLRAAYDDLDDVVATTCQVFLGLTANCARCHDHKIDPFPHRDYYRLLAFFHGVRRYSPRTSLRRLDGAHQGQALCVTEAGPTPPETFVLLRGDPRSKGDRVEPGFPSVLSTTSPVLPTPGRDAKSSGRRRVLAAWTASADNPLAARVMVNRLWQYHFGRGIVRSSSDFGYGGSPPTHPELLDWLATEFVRQGWSLKKLHRLMVTSSAYRMSSRPGPAALARDPENDLWSRFDLRRLSAEEVRDSVLAVCGNLNRARMGGPSIFPRIQREVLGGQSRPGIGWRPSSPDDQARRSVYIHIKRSLLVPLLAAFDAADTDSSCPVRFTTTQPTQALALLNGEFLNEQAGVFAADAQQQAGDGPAAQVRLALRRVTQREPSAREIDRGVQLMARLRSKHALAAPEALRRFCLLALNLNEFVYLD